VASLLKVVEKALTFIIDPFSDIWKTEMPLLIFFEDLLKGNL
jgi:hypothetical protein